MAAQRARRLLMAPFERMFVALGVQLERRRAAIARASQPRFATAAPGLVLQPPYEVRHADKMHVGHDVRIGPRSVLKVTTSYPGSWLQHPDGEHVVQSFDPYLEIGDRVTATANLHVVVYDRVTIEDDVLIASNVYISDGGHALARGDRPYKYQGIAGVAPIVIGRGSWIGQNAVILPGVTIGAYAVIGANAVVTRDVPAGAVAVGAPARVVRRWDAERDEWSRCETGPGDAETHERATITTGTT